MTLTVPMVGIVEVGADVEAEADTGAEADAEDCIGNIISSCILSFIDKGMTLTVSTDISFEAVLCLVFLV